MRILYFVRSQLALLSLLAGAALLTTAYYTGIPWIPDTVDPLFHLLHNLYSAMWSNMWAPSVWTLLGFVISDIRHTRRSNQVKLHHVDQLSDLAGQVAALSARLESLIGGRNDNS